MKKSSSLNSVEKYAQIKHRLKEQTVQNSSKLICLWILMWRQKRILFFTRGNVIMVWSSCLKLMVLFLSNTAFYVNVTRHSLIEWSGVGLLWCVYQLFGFLFWWHPFTAEDPLLRKWRNANVFKSVHMKKQTHLHLGWPEGEYVFSTFSFWGELFF